jgi:thioredoxin 1
MVVIELESLEQFNKILSLYKIVVVDNYADWCQPCKYLEPIFEKMSNQYSTHSVIFIKANADKRMFQVKGLPCIHFYVDGQQIDEVLGADVNKIESILNQLVSRNPITAEDSTRIEQIATQMAAETMRGSRPPTGNRHPHAQREPRAGVTQNKKSESRYKSYGDLMK